MCGSCCGLSLCFFFVCSGYFPNLRWRSVGYKICRRTAVNHISSVRVGLSVGREACFIRHVLQVGCAGCSCRCAGREVPRRREPSSVSQLPILQLGPLLAVCPLCCRRQPQLPCRGESRLVPELPILQSLRPGGFRAEIQRSQTVPCWSERRGLSQLSVLPLRNHVAGAGWCRHPTHNRTLSDWLDKCFNTCICIEGRGLLK